MVSAEAASRRLKPAKIRNLRRVRPGISPVSIVSPCCQLTQDCASGNRSSVAFCDRFPRARAKPVIKAPMH